MPRLAAFAPYILLCLYCALATVPAGCTGQTAPVRVPAQWAPDSTTVVRPAGPEYDRSAAWEFFWGKHYRDIWATPVTVPVLRLATALPGGLHPLQAGGSYQTRTLRLRAANGKDFVLRSVDKDASVALPAGWKRKLLGGLMKDQTSVAQPYGAYVAAQLAEVAGVYHTNPRLVYVGDDPGLGTFRKAYANDLYLLEERPDGNQTDVASFGHSPLVVNTGRMLADIHQRPSARVEARAYLRARLLDMWLGDWSRREDQWRWASFEQAGQVSYRPIPRDRDQAFFLFNDGAITRVVSWFVPKYQSFQASLSAQAVNGLTLTARELDRTLLATLQSEDFREVADSLRRRLTDATIAQALTAGPPETRAAVAKRFAPMLRARRDQLPQVAQWYYQLLAKRALLVGTDKAERFVLSEPGPGLLRVKMFAQRPNQADSLIMERTYNRRRTSSLAIYGLAGNDVFELTGRLKSRIRVHLYEGAGQNQLVLPAASAAIAGITWHSNSADKFSQKRRGITVRPNPDAAATANTQSWMKRYRL
ncbi:hypothetical protein [Hymenobacter arizonensis]|uniref:Uncharacterized protein n=1 Tax=Hymenobacter arizonensis TaxID=1227077 RepID=A0A1I5TVQ5_HYMAR|nr:hypothetical protein [Hymenobacter arizonensis]SFP87145.1 hypothetical protein SAMN04515668_0627 [Hymenobacter arizonensis]